MTALPIPDQTATDPVARDRGIDGRIFHRGDAAVRRRHCALSVLKRGTRVYLSAVPNRPAEESLDAAIRVRAAGFEPVPHVAVRNFASVGEFDDFLARLNGEAAVDSRACHRRRPCRARPVPVRA